ncbi:MAG: tryptophan--tRNA ligase [Acidobacteria bacterium]|nr:tryptophan--tRNA ligase [Acidobacteriota bacterium]MCA1638824.1 tryptophan--tRNA ligase [Acidobacteriota bacterium]
MRKRIFSGAQPTGNLHIGNYLGALKNWVALQEEYESFFCIVNLHAITLPQNPQVLKQKTLDLARIYLASGIDPQVSTVFIQSDVSEHAELAWTLNCIARMGELERMTQFKEKSQKGEIYGERFLTEKNTITRSGDKSPKIQFHDGSNSNVETRSLWTKSIKEPQKTNKIENERVGVGLFTYPVLMASDILLYQTDLVPIGQDQKQHLELSRDLAGRFNRDFGKTFVIPEPFIPPVGAKIQSLAEPSKKMSKSDENANGAIFLLDDADTITKKIKRAVTDSGTDIKFDETRPAINNLLTVYQLLTNKTVEQCEADFEGKGYGHFKTELAETVVEFLRPFQERVKEFDDVELSKILKEGAEKARLVASETLKDVYAKIGIVSAK